MPAGKDNSSSNDGGGGSTNAAGRTTFRPPWVREGPNPLPVPTAPWTLKNTSRRGSNNTEEQPPPNTLQSINKNLFIFFYSSSSLLLLFLINLAPKLRKTTPNSKVTVSQAQENGSNKETFVKPQLKPVPPKETSKLQSKEVKVPIKLNSVKNNPTKAEDKRLQSLKSEDPEAIDKVSF